MCSGSHPWKARRKFSRFLRIVAHDRPAWKPASISISNSSRSSWHGTPHSSSWYATISGSSPGQAQLRSSNATGSTSDRSSPVPAGEPRERSCPALSLLQLRGRNGPHAAGPIVRDRLDDLVVGVHHEGAVEDGRLADRQPAEQQDLEARRTAGLARIRLDGQSIARPEHAQLTLANRPPFRPDAARAGERIGQGIEVRP